jgi:geranylgeranyl pyrophosphate synthase
MEINQTQLQHLLELQQEPSQEAIKKLRDQNAEQRDHIEELQDHVRHYETVEEERKRHQETLDQQNGNLKELNGDLV